MTIKRMLISLTVLSVLLLSSIGAVNGDESEPGTIRDILTYQSIEMNNIYE